MFSTIFPSSIAFKPFSFFSLYNFLVSSIDTIPLFLTSIALSLELIAILLPSKALLDKIFMLESTSCIDALISSDDELVS